MPSWLLSLLQIPKALSERGYRSLKRRFADRQALIREGAEIVTPIIDRARRSGPEATMWGTDQEVLLRLHTAETEWQNERTALLTYANLHPSEEIRQLAQHTALAVQQALNATIYLVHSRKTASDASDYQASRDRQTEAVDIAQKLMDTIRAY